MSTRADGSRSAVAAIIFVIFGIAFAGSAAIATHSEQTSYFDRSTPPLYVHVTEGKTYLLSVHGGLQALSDLGVDPANLTCQYVTPEGPTVQSLTLSVLGNDTKAVNAIGTIEGPVTGKIRVTCPSFAGNVYLDGADNAPFDLAGLYILLCMISLTVGLGLGIATLRGARTRPAEYTESVEPQGVVR